VDYTSLLTKYCDATKLKAHDPKLYEDIVETGFFRADLKPEEDLKGKDVIDLGAHIGVFTLSAIAHGAKAVFSVEMNPINYSHLIGFTKDIPNVKCQNWAIFDGITRYVYHFDEGTLSKAAKTGDKEKAIPAFSLEEILDFSKFQGDDITLKIDVEGSEYDVLLSAPSRTLRRFSRIFMETHPVPHNDGPGKNAKFLKEYLAYFGFEVVKYTPIYWLKHDDQGREISWTVIDNLELLKLVRKG